MLKCSCVIFKFTTIIYCYKTLLSPGEYVDKYSSVNCASLKKKGRCSYDAVVRKNCERTCSGCPSKSDIKVYSTKTITKYRSISVINFTFPSSLIIYRLCILDKL